MEDLLTRVKSIIEKDKQSKVTEVKERQYFNEYPCNVVEYLTQPGTITPLECKAILLLRDFDGYTGEIICEGKAHSSDAHEKGFYKRIKELNEITTKLYGLLSNYLTQLSRERTETDIQVIVEPQLNEYVVIRVQGRSFNKLHTELKKALVDIRFGGKQ